MIFEQTILPIFVLIAVTAAIWYGVRTRRIEVVTDARAGAFAEASQALQSLADIANDAAKAYIKDGQTNIAHIRAAQNRGYFYNRAASIVASIPASR